MGSITPLLDTLLHQVLGRQLSLDAHARQPIGPAAVSAVIRDGGVDDAVHSEDAAADEQGASHDSDFADTFSSIRPRQQTDAASVASSSRRMEAPSSPSAASAQLALSDTARALSEKVRFETQQTLLDDISGEILSESLPSSVSPDISLLPNSAAAKHASSQPSILLPPSSSQAPSEVSNAGHHNEVGKDPSSFSDSAALNVSFEARHMNQWTAVLSRQDWQSLLMQDEALPMPLTLLSTALILDNSGDSDSSSLESLRDNLSNQFIAALKTSGLFHEALLVEWAHDRLPLEIVEQSALQRQQLVSVLPSAPEFGDAVIRQQLQLMAGQPIHFQSELWAGAMMLMSFKTEPYLSAAHPDDSAERRFPAFPEQRRLWTLTLTFEMPLLGTVTATLQWDEERLSVTLDAEHEKTRQLLIRHREQLEQLLNDEDDANLAINVNAEHDPGTA